MTRRTTFMLVVVEERTDSERPPSYDADATGEEASGVHRTLKPVAKAAPRLAEVVPLFRRRTA